MVLHKPLSLVVVCDDLNRPLTNLMNEATVKVTLAPSIEFLELVKKLDLTQRGRFSWSLPTKDNGRVIAAFIREYSETFLPKTVISSMDNGYNQEVETTSPSTYYEGGAYHSAFEPYAQFRQALDALPDFKWPKIADLPMEYRNARYTYQRQRNNGAAIDATTMGGVTLEVTNNTFWVRLFPVKDMAEKDTVHMPKVKNVKVSKETYLAPRNVNKVLADIKKTWGDVLDARSDEVRDLLTEAERVVTVGYSPNQPATVLLTRGNDVDIPRIHALRNFKAGVETKITIEEAIELEKQTKNVPFLIHPALSDIVSMTKAKPYMGDKRLKPYQKKAVGLHLSTKIGYLQSCSPGMGKTVIQLVAMKAKAETTPNYRALVITEANVRKQWAEEAEIWWPEAKIVTIEKATDIDKLAEALAETEPVVVLCSYSHTLLAYYELEKRKEENLRLINMRYLDRLQALKDAPIPELTVGSMLLDGLWEDICADEAVIIRNGTSKAAQILWTLRKNSKVATALTATPINKSPDDIARLISWVRNDRNLFTGVPLSEQYDTATEAGARALFKIFGPLVFRRDTSEIAKEIPKVRQTVHKLTPSPAELALATAAEKELKRCYLELVAALEEVDKAGTADKDELKKVKEALRAANGAWLGGTQLARMATSDPNALLESTSVGAALLTGQGLIDEALKFEPTKRKKFIAEAQERILKGEQILVFTEFATVANVLVRALQDNGINAQAYTGKNGATRDRARQDFQAGNLDILVCTQAAERGLTLHKAAAIYHYDLPWTLEKIIQRTGRGVRIGSKNAHIDIVFMIMAGTIEERMANHLVEQGMSASLVMDYSRGVALKNTETAMAMSGLMTSMAKGSDNKNLIRFGELLLGV